MTRQYGLDNRNSCYGTDPLNNVKNAAIRGMKAGMINSGLGYSMDELAGGIL